MHGRRPGIMSSFIERLTNSYFDGSKSSAIAPQPHADDLVDDPAEAVRGACRDTAPRGRSRRSRAAQRHRVRRPARLPGRCGTHVARLVLGRIDLHQILAIGPVHQVVHDDHVLSGTASGAPCAAEEEDVVGRQHQDPGLCLCLPRSAGDERHLVAVEVRRRTHGADRADEPSIALRSTSTSSTPGCPGGAAWHGRAARDARR